MTLKELQEALKKFALVAKEVPIRDHYGNDYVAISILDAQGKSVVRKYSTTEAESEVAHARDQALEALIFIRG